MFQVKRISYTENNGAKTTTQKLWSIERNCTSKCEPGCVMFGQLYSCTSCCNTLLCNTDQNGAPNIKNRLQLNLMGMCLYFILIKKL